MRAHILFSPEPDDAQILQGYLTQGIEITTGKDLDNADLIDVLVTGRPNPEHLTHCRNLRAIIIPFAGIPKETLALLQKYPGVEVYNLHHNAKVTAEMAIALLLAAARFLIPADQHLRRNDWTPRYQSDKSLSLFGKNALILGFGNIGQQIGRVCHALGMNVTGIRRDIHKPIPVDYPVGVYPLDDLHNLLINTHVLMVALPATTQTQGLIGDDEIKAMPRGGVLVNIGRGSIIDQRALYKNLQSKHLRAAGIDVWYNYPETDLDWGHTSPADYPFGELDNVVLSPHRAGGFEGIERLRMIHLAKLLNELYRGASPMSQVDTALGY